MLNNFIASTILRSSGQRNGVLVLGSYLFRRWHLPVV